MLSEAALHDIIEAGVWAPSAENRHAFRYAIEGDSVRLRPDAALGALTADQHYVALLSIGAAIENMCIAASVHAAHLEAHYAPDGTGDVLLECAAEPASEDALAEFLRARHTNRRVLFRGPRLSGAEQREIEMAARAHDARWLVQWFDERHARAALCRLMIDAEAQRFAVPALHAAMFGGIRFDLSWRAGAAEGLPPGALQIEPGMRGAFALLRHWRYMAPLARLGMHRAIAYRAAYWPARRAPHLVVVASHTPLAGARDLIEAGRAMERVWLAATQLDLAVQPFAASVALARPGASALDAQAHEALESGWRALMPAAHPVMIFRLGHARPPAVRAGRPHPATLALHARA